MKEQKFKYCPTCEKKVAVVNHGNQGKQRFQCKFCGKSFVERNYGIEVRSLAVKLREYDYSLRDIAKVFSINSPNSVRNWVKENCVYDIPYQAYFEELKKYKELSGSIKALQAQLSKWRNELSIAEVYWQTKNEINELEQLQNSVDRRNPYEAPNYTIYGFKIDRLHKDLVRMQKPKDFMTVEQIRNLHSSVKEELDKQINLIADIQNNCVFARDNYDIDKIISALEKILQTK